MKNCSKFIFRIINPLPCVFVPIFKCTAANNELTGEFGNKRIEWQPWRRNEKVGKELRGVESVLHFEAGIARANFRHPTFGRTGANKTSAHLMNAWICE
ncbi:unnamed protein product [Nesidiocoris tenuis]|uniref:Uncharacterized protein n=1 Tax=Nesidiocoris tenuis TaxID=355587 RepID=A0A6H5HNA6_9HEMI|nr:unnamed protein product [Nesidiocoris tenuis]